LNISTDIQKILNIRFHKSPSCVSRVVACGQTDRQTWLS